MNAIIDPSVERRQKAEKRLRDALEKTGEIMHETGIHVPEVVASMAPVILQYVFDHDLAG